MYWFDAFPSKLHYPFLYPWFKTLFLTFKLVPDTEDEEESSFVEGPKPTEKEQDEIGVEVDKALEENFEECEKSKERKAKENDAKSEETNGVKPETNGVKSETNGVKSETNGVKSEETNGDAMETDDKDVDVKSDSLIPFNT